MTSKLTREPITHKLKIYPEFFSAVCTGVKRAELRKNDRDYRVGDTLHLMETPRGSCHRTGEFINVKITHIADVGEWMPGYVLLSVELQELRKAAMDSEPVAVIDKEGNPMTRDECNDDRIFAICCKVGTPLYTHPAPSIPSAVTWCPKCNDTGLADSGGVQPWGEPILIECDCRAEPAPVAQCVPLGDSPYDVPHSMPSTLRELIAEEIGILFSDDDAQSVWDVCRRAAMLAAAPQEVKSE